MQRVQPGAAEVGGALARDGAGGERIEWKRHHYLLVHKMLELKLLVRKNSDGDRLTSRHFAWKLRL